MPSPSLPLWLHALAACLACWRLTELVTADRLTAGLRRRLPDWYLLACPRCVSVWAGAASSLLLWLAPWANWPFALAWTYLWLRAIHSASRLHTLPREATMAGLTEKEWAAIVNRQAGQIAQMSANTTVLQVQLESAQERITELERQLGLQGNGAKPAPDAIMAVPAA